MATAVEHLRDLNEAQNPDLSSEIEKVRVQNIRQWLQQPISLLLEADSAELIGVCGSLSARFLQAASALRKRATPLEEGTYDCILALEFLGGLLRKVRGTLTFEANEIIMKATLDLRRKLRSGSVV